MKISDFPKPFSFRMFPKRKQETSSPIFFWDNTGGLKERKKKLFEGGELNSLLRYKGLSQKFKKKIFKI